MDTINKFESKFIKDFFTKEELDLLQKYCSLRLDENWKEPRFFNDALIKYFHEIKLKIVERECNLDLFKTFSYWKCFVYGDDLPKHISGPNNEISVIASINQSKKWPVQIGKKQYILDEGDAVLFLGNKLLKKRKAYKHDFNMQVFFNYVNQKGSFAYHKDNKLEKDIPEWKNHII
tara:strand:+ start:141 stop:668 length:528 start_codon:yes stop_codon:yes gene_type:complete